MAEKPEAAYKENPRKRNHLNLTSAEEETDPSLSSADARRKATIFETQTYDAASSLDDYHRRCAEKIQDLSQNARSRTLAEQDQERVPSPTGIAIGRYQNAVYWSEGLFSVVYKASAPEVETISSTQSNSGQSKVVALKVTTPSVMEPPHDSRREARILDLAASDHVIPVLETCRDAGSQFVLVFPFMPFVLDQLLHDHELSKPQARLHLRDLFSALDFIHSQRIVHRDIKPSNILLRSIDGPAYLSDFGIAWAPTATGSEPAESKITDVGTTCYRPPELLFGNKQYGTSLDLWAAGCTVAEVVVHKHPTLFDSGELGSDLALIQSIFTKLGTPNLEVWPEAATFPDWGKMQFHEYPPQSWDSLLPDVSETERDLVSQLVRYESGARMTASQVLAQPYFVD
ncbi:kinase-like protein [Lophiostoma macrostomum CBS 122681]|uniref:cyclin-dependent kinase n=1 Tax=Lophiostoma macrostomum CBS 122681 TaxID=1314788 RepID=A0A6A6SPL3_9PLEO|nr:kinase-like protein [Lophiostoma macrostomum CBS 122681]